MKKIKHTKHIVNPCWQVIQNGNLTWKDDTTLWTIEVQRV